MCVILLELRKTWRRRIMTYYATYNKKLIYQAPTKTAYKVSAKQPMWTKHQMKKTR